MPRQSSAGEYLGRKLRIVLGRILNANTIKEIAMAEPSQQLRQALQFLPPHHIGDPAVLLESILAHVETAQHKQVIGLYMDSLTAALEANLKFVRGVHSIIMGARN